MARSLSPRSPNQLSAEKETGLLTEALLEFQEKGVDSASVDDIAKRAGISKGAIYRRFSNKDELFEAVVVRKVVALDSALGDFEVSTDQPSQSLELAAKTIRGVTVRNIDFLRLLLAEVPRRVEVCQAARIGMNQMIAAKLKPFFLELISLGKMSPVDVDVVVWSFFILSVGGMRPLFNLMNDDFETQDARRLKTDLDLFLAGCGIKS